MDYCLAQLYYLFVCNILNVNGSLWIIYRKLSNHIIWNRNFLKLKMIETLGSEAHRHTGTRYHINKLLLC